MPVQADTKTDPIPLKLYREWRDYRDILPVVEFKGVLKLPKNNPLEEFDDEQPHLFQTALEHLSVKYSACYLEELENYWDGDHWNRAQDGDADGGQA